MVGLHLAVLIIFSEAAPANGVDTAFYIFTVVSLPSGASVRKDVWVQVPPSALKKLVFTSFSFLSCCCCHSHCIFQSDVLIYAIEKAPICFISSESTKTGVIFTPVFGF